MTRIAYNLCKDAFKERVYRPWPVDGEFYVVAMCKGFLDLCVKVNDKMIYLATVKCPK